MWVPLDQVSELHNNHLQPGKAGHLLSRCEASARASAVFPDSYSLPHNCISTLERVLQFCGDLQSGWRAAVYL
ncbi:hypothetical protein IG631_23790 [Alternaria alternata]|nr:hypothetical protein IG631_23790 [Alternaria alternata]